jgi:uncharacterized protein (DUF736 family)
MGAGIGLPNSARAASISKILNYNPDMEYRRLGKTNLMLSAVALGGHWKRVRNVNPKIRPGTDWIDCDLDDPEFKKNATRLQPVHRGRHQLCGCVLR